MREWSQITRGETWEDSGRCCSLVDEHGAPECCYTLVSGVDRLTFTWFEVMAIEDQYGVPNSMFMCIEDNPSLMVYAGDMEDGDHRDALRDGWMSKTLECASHPLRPILGPKRVVIGTVAIDGCNTQLELERYKDNREEIAALWQVTIDNFGVKPYYVDHWIKEGWYVL